MNTSPIIAEFATQEALEEALLDLGLARWMGSPDHEIFLYTPVRFLATSPYQTDTGIAIAFFGKLSPEQIEGLEPYAPTTPEVSLGESEGRI